jgi:hypothetical protein
MTPDVDLRYPSTYNSATHAPERACAQCNRPLKAEGEVPEPRFVRMVNGSPTARVRLCKACAKDVPNVVLVPEVVR